MKKFIFLVLVLTSCSNVLVQYPNVPRDKDPAVVDDWMGWNISYKTDLELYGHNDYWASYDETYRNKAGDCEDKAYFFNMTMYKNTGRLGKYEVYWIPWKKQYHLVANFEGYRFGYIEGGEYVQDYSFEYVDRNIGYYSDRSLSSRNLSDSTLLFD